MKTPDLLRTTSRNQASGDDVRDDVRKPLSWLRGAENKIGTVGGTEG